MKTKYLILLLSLIAVFYHDYALADDDISFEILDYGVMDYTIKKIKSNSGVAGGTINKIVNESIIYTTDQVPAQIGTLFGFIYKIHGDDKGHKIRIKNVSLCPELKDPTQGKVFTKNEFESTKKVGSMYSRAYLFNYDWELVPGVWVFQIWHEGQKMAEKRFTVYSPQQI